MNGEMSDCGRNEVRRQQVLNAAEKCFRLHGFHGASMAQIARTAGMSCGHIYNLFQNKEDVIKAIVARDQAQWLARADAMSQATDVAQALIESVGVGVEKCTALECAALRLEIVAEAGRNAKLAAIVQAGDSVVRGHIRALLQAALVQRGIEVDADVLEGRAAALAAVFDGLMVRAVRDPSMSKPLIIDAIRHLVSSLMLEREGG